LVPDVLATLAEQIGVVSGSAAAGKVLPRPATSLVRSWPSDDRLPPRWRGSSMATFFANRPGVGVRTAAQVLLDVGGSSAFPCRTPGDYAGPGHLTLGHLDPR